MLENQGLTTADTAVNQNLYSLPQSNSVYMPVSTFTLKTTRISITAGASTNTVLAVVRRVPSGYTEPTITVATGLTDFWDVPNILAYGMVQVFANSVDPMTRIDLEFIKRTIPVYAGDRIVIQAVCNASSSGQKINVLAEYTSA